MSTSPFIPENKPATGRVLAENVFVTVLLGLTAVLPCIQVVARLFSLPGIRGSEDYIQSLVLWTALAGGALTAREGRHLALTVGFDRFSGRAKEGLKTATSLVSVVFSTILAFSALSFALLGFAPSQTVGPIPLSVVCLIMPAGYALITARFVAQASPRPSGRWIAALGILAGVAMSAEPLANIFSLAPSLPAAAGLSAFFQRVQEALVPVIGVLHLPLIAVLIAGALLGAPIFVLLGGLAVLFFLHSGGSLEVIPNQAYTMLSGPIIPALPLFTLAGYIISESKAGERLVRLFRAFFGWMPGGLTIMSVLICAFLTTFTGASGVTILAVGGLLFYVLASGGYKESFTTGLLTASGSIGLLFPPSLPIILYGVMAQVDIRQMFVGGVVPGFFMILVLSAMGIFRSMRDKVPRIPFRIKEAARSIPGAALEILLPALILVLFFGGIMTLVETAAFSVVYAFAIEVMVHRDIKWRRIPEVFIKSAVVMGGVLVIISAAYGLQYYIIDAQIPGKLAQWLHEAVRSKYVFLLLLNLALLVVGSFMDIFSAITVVVPLILPLARAYGVDPVHLGIIFLANLELGYLTPPVGLNLYLASYRFGQPLGKIVRETLPFLLILLVAVLVITYVPGLTTFLLSVIRF
jgi:C4-dicarboxylate transporter DctM subunit